MSIGHVDPAADGFLDEAARADVVRAIERIEGVFVDLCIRGLRLAGANELASLEALHEELLGLGARRLAEAVGDVLEMARAGDPRGGAALMRAAITLRLFERVLSLEAAAEPLQRWVEAAEPA